jgi:hypothetical protein
MNMYSEDGRGNMTIVDMNAINAESGSCADGESSATPLSKGSSRPFPVSQGSSAKQQGRKSSKSGGGSHNPSVLLSLPRRSPSGGESYPSSPTHDDDGNNDGEDLYFEASDNEESESRIAEEEERLRLEKKARMVEKKELEMKSLVDSTITEGWDEQEYDSNSEEHLDGGVKKERRGRKPSNGGSTAAAAAAAAAMSSTAALANSKRRKGKKAFDDPNFVLVSHANLYVGTTKVTSALEAARLVKRGEDSWCKCRKSRCLKLYCDCFQAGNNCLPDCGCSDCLNTSDNSGANGIRTNAVVNALLRRPDAFEKRVKELGNGCGCKNSGCLKKYCECFRESKACDSSVCKCNGCKNIDMSSSSSKGRKSAAPPQAPVAKVGMFTPVSSVSSSPVPPNGSFLLQHQVVSAGGGSSKRGGAAAAVATSTAGGGADSKLEGDQRGSADRKKRKISVVSPVSLLSSKLSLDAEEAAFAASGGKR